MSQGTKKSIQAVDLISELGLAVLDGERDEFGAVPIRQPVRDRPGNPADSSAATQSTVSELAAGQGKADQAGLSVPDKPADFSAPANGSQLTVFEATSQVRIELNRCGLSGYL